MKKWTKPLIGVIGIAAASAYVLTVDGWALASDPLQPPEPHETFQFMTATGGSSAAAVMQDMVTGNFFEVPGPEHPRGRLPRYFKIV